MLRIRENQCKIWIPSFALYYSNKKSQKFGNVHESQTRILPTFSEPLICYSLWNPIHNMQCFLSYFFLIDLYWSIIASQYCVSFCCTTKRISRRHTHVPISPPSWASLPSSLSHPSRSSQSTKPMSLCYAAASHQPTILHSLVYIRRCYSHFAPAWPSYPMSSSPFSMSTSLFLPCN